MLSRSFHFGVFEILVSSLFLLVVFAFGLGGADIQYFTIRKQILKKKIMMFVGAGLTRWLSYSSNVGFLSRQHLCLHIPYSRAQFLNMIKVIGCQSVKVSKCQTHFIITSTS